MGPVWTANGDYVLDRLPPSEHCCHLLDVVCRLMGEPVEVFAYGRSFTGRPGPDAALRLRGSNHTWRSMTYALRDGTRPDAVTTVVLPPEELGRTRYSDAFEHFFSCVRSGATPEATPTNGERAVFLAPAINESIVTGRPTTVDGPGEAT